MSGADPSAAATSPPEVVEPLFTRDLDDIRKRDTLVVLTEYNSTTYFLYKGEPLGYEYELLREFAADNDLFIQMVVVPDRDSLFSMLNSGKGDIAAARLIPLSRDSGKVSFTRELYRTDPVLVQQKDPVQVAKRRLPAAVDTMLAPGPAERGPAISAARVRLIMSPKELAGRRVDVPQQSPHAQTLIELADTLTGSIQVVEVDASSEALIREVAKGNVQYTVTEGNVADLQSSVYTNLRVRPVVGGSQKIAWAVRRNAPVLLAQLDAWIGNEKTGPLFNTLYRKYFNNSRAFQQRVASRYLTSETGQLSAYDPLIKQHATVLGWDWRLLASQMYQESRFNPRARSWAGATGLLQLMPRTARQFGVRNSLDPAQNVAGGVRFLQWLTKYWEKRIEDPNERLKFILASYNTGAGHVEDAQRLAEAHKDNPKIWKDVSYWLLQKSKREIHTLPVVRYGYSRGIEPVTYVSTILDRFNHYRQFVTRDERTTE